MIVFRKLQWSYAFSYGANNSIDLDKAPLTQLVGENGHGKSSIALILEEVLFNKNSKGIKKSDILNRNCTSKNYTISLEFTKDSAEYKVTTVRGSTQTVKLEENGVDISSHTSTATYKSIESILGFDHKSFCQIVYQSSPFSLEFLTDTDTARKKFLIELLDLTKYTNLSQIFKDKAKEVSNEAEVLNLKLQTTTEWLNHMGKKDMTPIEPVEVPEEPTNVMRELKELEETLAGIEQTNKRITQNNTYKSILDSIDLTQYPPPSANIMDLNVDVKSLKAKQKQLNSVVVGGPKALYSTCPTCGQSVDNSHKVKMSEEAKANLVEIEKIIDEKIKELNTATEQAKKHELGIKSQNEWEKYYSLIQKDLPEKLLDKDTLADKIKELSEIVFKQLNKIKELKAKNIKIAEHNAKVSVMQAQAKTMEDNLAKYSAELKVINAKLANLQVLVKTFSTTGLIAYKIECMVKDLEEITNEYLQDMSDGRFQLSFKVNAADKLNVIITDNGVDIDIAALSNGEKARVNISALLGIRKLMQAVSNSRVNLLILDETIESLDATGKEKLIEVLLKEQYLNTILVSHGFTHPLLEKTLVVKVDDESRIEA